MHIFYPVAIETGGTWNHWAVGVVQDIGRCPILITGEPRKSIFYFRSCQQPSKGKMRSPSSTSLTLIRRCCSHTLLHTMFKACGFVQVGEKKIMNGNVKINRKTYAKACVATSYCNSPKKSLTRKMSVSLERSVE